MKKIIYLFVALGALMIFSACKKTGGNINPLSSVDNLATGSYITLDTKQSLTLNLDFSNLAASKVGINITASPSGKAVDHVDVYVSQAATFDPTKWKKVKTVAYTGAGTQISVSGSELASSLGVSLASFSPGTSYNFYQRVFTTDGASYDVSNTGANAGSGIQTGPNYHAAFIFQAFIVCPFIGPVGGTYKVVRDDWADWNPGDFVQVTDGPGANVVNISKVYPGPSLGVISSPLLIMVDPATGAATVPKTTYGIYNPGGASNTAFAIGANSSTGAAGFVFSCTGYIGIQLAHTYGGSPQGTFTLILQKQ